ncbi:UvrD-helicase domain-containing protein [Stenotrophomonas maltophilia]|uniref:UvrD-helicase domain-containing protein n=1 Tax=Stenotrophomonas maltophilia TaxID=40324 RepID=UPI001110B666|nr:UvrD-helicase domain-containing protein [Stenotrophomonas maltophilia]TIL14959.1 ATP-dependent helicase [Stenotrophomonas maltophilia]
MERIVTEADRQVWGCLDARRSFALVAGAGSGKTSSLVDALMRVRENDGALLRQSGQKIACITYTKRAVRVINERLGFDDLYAVSTVHSFLWGLIGGFSFDIGQALKSTRIPELIDKAREKDRGNSKAARLARAKVMKLEGDLSSIDEVSIFSYTDSISSNYLEGELGHDDIVAISSILLATNATLRRIVGLRYPFIFVDEAQDTNAGIVAGLNLASESSASSLVGYFGDPWQQIYEGSTVDFVPPEDGLTITKTENFRCSESVIRLLNSFRQDVTQYAAGENAGREGSVLFRLVQSEAGALPRGRYSDEQLARTGAHFDRAITEWGWQDDDEVIQLFLVRQMIARRLGFSKLNKLFTGDYSSGRSQDAYESGDHYLLQPFLKTIWPIVSAYQSGDTRAVIDIVRRDSPLFDVAGQNAERSLKEMLDAAASLAAQLVQLWLGGTLRDVLRFCVEMGLVRPTSRLREQLDRSPREEDYDDEVHALEKGDWLADSFFRMPASEIGSYASFMAENTPYSTQHGVKGEEYSKVIVVYDDIEAAWSQYSFSKLLTPQTTGQPTDGQRDRGRRLAYVSFSRALLDLRVLLFTADPHAARDELIAIGLLEDSQIEIA